MNDSNYLLEESSSRKSEVNLLDQLPAFQGKNKIEMYQSPKPFAPSDGIQEIFARGIRRTQKIFAMESGNKPEAIQIPLKTGIQNPRSTDKESGIRGVESRIQNCVGFPCMGRKAVTKETSQYLQLIYRILCKSIV